MPDNNLPTLGMDISDHSIELCEIDFDGDVTFRGRIPCTEKALRSFFVARKYRRTVLEAGSHSPWIARLLEELGQSPLVVNPRRLAAITQSKTKNDRNDAELLARLGRADETLLSPVGHRSVDAQKGVARLRARDSLVTARTKLINAARGLAKPFGFRFPSCTAAAFAKRARESVPSELEPILAHLLAAIAVVSEQIDAYDKDLVALAAESFPDTQLVQQVAGVGPVTALAFIVTVDDPKRFVHVRDVGAWLGLVPGQDQSGEANRQLRITKQGDSYLRRLLVTSAQYILGPFGPDTDLRRFGLTLAERGGKTGKKRAVVAVARKLSVLLLSMWRSGEVYQPLRGEGVPRKPLHLRRSTPVSAPMAASA